MNKIWLITAVLAVSAAIIGGIVYYWPKIGRFSPQVLAENASDTGLTAAKPLPTPAMVKGIYMTGYTFSQPSRREKLFKLIQNTELNSAVIDFKDPGGKLMVKPADERLAGWPISSVALKYDNYKAILNDLQSRGIYTIARITTFQDSAAARAYPDLALKNAGGGVWQDYKGVTWLDMTNREAWKLVAAQIKEAENIGFDEVQLDYIRFPSDGNLKSIAYVDFPAGSSRTAVLRDFYAFLRQDLADLGIPLSVDLFGLTYQRHPENPGYDMGIGQFLADSAEYFDYISPMVYPSHYQSAYAGCDIPVLCPYKVVSKAMKEGAAIMASSSYPVRATTRPWLQDFNLGAVYTADRVRAQIQAAEDNNVSGWLLWNAGNNYTVSALSQKVIK